MKLYRLHSKQLLPISIDEAWNFLSDPNNLRTITPQNMSFTITSGNELPMYSGQIVQYIVKPFPWYTTKWVTEITHLKEGEYFVDEQRFGPYALWHHKHFIKKIEGGVEMKDVIDYKIPFGILGRLANYIIVRKQLHRIFNYRAEKLIQLFGSIDGHKHELQIK
ncbi:SRPBCC family protein [Maribacter sp. MMG018]|uniref:SRPBCC family protein n=1 Tax=Maribacter sp. MMG018 TaxID=2822688 RepID=UPI001B3635B2|nr:SRPBCC family protein [Maribacter sp. MMG018]MBQ4915254.1 SRPBCC family protein [Maribacter sp. MMG018]